MQLDLNAHSTAASVYCKIVQPIAMYYVHSILDVLQHTCAAAGSVLVPYTSVELIVRLQL